MTDILDFQTNDEILNNVMSNNPFYAHIKGEVNLCLVRCGQEIEACNSIEFSTMTNYGKILVLNPNPSKIATCAIKLAYDTTSDNTDNNGLGKYKFEKAFFTTPSLHRINEKIFDLETFLLFSSTQNDGSKIYVCLCALNNAVDNVQSNDSKLLNFKLLNELFSNNNSVPDIHGTNEIKGVPNPVDLGNFLPKIGKRNFYDYTHPKNTKVNFRIYQTPLAVSNNTLNILKNKLVPNPIYTNFRNAIMTVQNPSEGLYFYFSEDLTDKYKNFAANEGKEEKESKKEEKESKKEEKESKKEKKEKFEESEQSLNKNPSEVSIEDISKNLIKEQENHEQKKTEEDDKLKNMKNEKENIDDKSKEKFDNDTKSSPPISKITSIFIIVFTVFYLAINIVSYFIIDRSSNNYIDSVSTPPVSFSENELTPELGNFLTNKFRYFFTTFIQIIITIIIIILSIVKLSTSDISFDETYKLSISILLFLFFIGGIFIFYFIIQYIFTRLQITSLSNFTEKQIYFYKYYYDHLNFGNFFTFLFSGTIKDSSLKKEHIEQLKTFFVGQSGGYISSTEPEYVPGPSIIDSEQTQNPVLGILSSSGGNIHIGHFIYDLLFGNKIENKLGYKLGVSIFIYFVILFSLGIYIQTILCNSDYNINCTLQGFLSPINNLYCIVPFGLGLIFFISRLGTSKTWNIISNGFRIITYIILFLNFLLPTMICVGTSTMGILGILMAFIIGIFILFGGYCIINSSISSNIHGLSSIPLSPSAPPSIPGEIERMIEKYECEIELLNEKIENIKNQLNNDPTDNNSLKEMLKLKEQLNDITEKLRYLKKILKINKTNNEREIARSIEGVDKNNENTLLSKEKEDEFEKIKEEYKRYILILKEKIDDISEKSHLIEGKNNSNLTDGSLLETTEIAQLKETINRYEREILKSKNRESQQKNKNLYLRKNLEAQQRMLNKLLIQLSLEKTKSSTNLIKLLQNIILILQQFSTVSKNHNNTTYYKNVQQILEQLKTDSIKTLKEIEIQKLNKNSSNYNKIINQLKEILKSILGEIN
jgi:hypothetical protein